MLHFDSSPLTYWLPCSLLCFGLIWVALRKQLSDGGFALLSVGILFLLRLPTLVYNREINPDESQMITQGRTLAVDPVYFRSVDGTTIGPLDSYVLILPTWVGFSYDYIAARTLGLVLIACSLLFLYKTARDWFGVMPARLALLPLLFALGLTQNGDLLSYCSELVPLFLLSAGVWLWSRVAVQPKPAYGLLFLLGLLIGMVPFGKLQGAPLAAVLGLVAAISVLNRAAPWISRLGQLAALGFGAVTFPILFISYVGANGYYDDFWLFYIEGNLRYGSNTDHWQNILHLPAYLLKAEELGMVIFLAIGLGLAALLHYFTATPKPTLTGVWPVRLAYMALSVLAALYAITRTGTEFIHYFYLAIVPLLLLMALSWKVILRASWIRAWPSTPVWVTGLLLTVIVGEDALNYLRHIPLNPYPSDRQIGFATPQLPIVEQIRKFADEGEALVVWGWRCDYYVSAAMWQGTAENHSERCVFVSPMTPLYQRRYLNNFLRSVPPVFVDAVGSQNGWLTDRKTQGHEIIKPLAQFIQKHYQYMGLYNDARLYVRKDRIRYVE